MTVRSVVMNTAWNVPAAGWFGVCVATGHWWAGCGGVALNFVGFWEGQVSGIRIARSAAISAVDRVRRRVP